MPTCGYACINCGRCKGRMPKPILVPLCIACGHENPFGSETCEQCGASLELRPGVTNTVGQRLPSSSGAFGVPSVLDAAGASDASSASGEPSKEAK